MKYLISFFVLATALPLHGQLPRLVLPFGYSDIFVTSYSPDQKKILTYSSDSTCMIWDAVSGLRLISFKGYAAAFTHDSKRIAVASGDSIIKVYSLNTSELLEAIKGFSPDKKRFILMANASGITIWDPYRNDERIPIKHIPDGWRELISPDNTKSLVIGHRPATVTLWNLMTGKRTILRSDKLKSIFEYSAAFSNNSRLIAVKKERKLEIYDAHNGSLIDSLTLHSPDPKTKMVFTPNDDRIAVAIYDSVLIFNTTGLGQVSSIYTESANDNNPFLFNSNGSILAYPGRHDKTQLFSVPAGNLVGEIEGDKWKLLSSYFAKTSRGLISASGEDTEAREWNLMNEKPPLNLKGHSSGVRLAYAAGKNGSLITQSAEGNFNIWDFTTNTLLSIPGLQFTMDVLAHSTNGELLFVANHRSNKGYILDAFHKKIVDTISWTSGSIESAGFSPDNKRIFAYFIDNEWTYPEIHTFRVWDIHKKMIWEIKTENNPVSTGFSKDGSKLLVTGGEGNAVIMNVATGRVEKKFAEYITTAIWSPSEDKIAFTDDNHLWIRDMKTGRILMKKELANQGMSPSMEFSPSGNLIVMVYEGGIHLGTLVEIWDVKKQSLKSSIISFMFNSYVLSRDETKIAIRSADDAEIYRVSSGEEINSVAGFQAFGKDSKTALGISQSLAQITDIASGKTIVEYKGHTSLINYATFINDSFVLTSSEDNTCKLWEMRTGRQVSSFAIIDGSDYFVQVPSGYYSCTPYAARLLHYVTNDLRVITFRQLDVRFNRPDMVLKEMGSTNTSLIGLYNKAYLKRIKKLGIDTLSFNSKYNVPECDVTIAGHSGSAGRAGNIDLEIRASDSVLLLDKLNIFVNEVPLLGVEGISIREYNARHFDTTFTALLSAGENRIEASVTNINGIESYRKPLFVTYTPSQPEMETTCFVGIGVGRFDDQKMNLKYTERDIRSLDSLFMSHFSHYKSFILLDSDVTKENIGNLADSLKKTGINDRVIVAVSGHGLVDDSLDFYLATTGIEFQHPAEKGISYNDLENLLNDIPARKKLLLLDACHSGEIDKEDIREMSRERAGGSLLDDVMDAKKRSRQQQQGGGIGLQNSFELMKELFNDVSRSNGTIVISAARGNELANEGDKWGNGAFTYAVRLALSARKNNSPVTISYLKDFVSRKVDELTEGKQKPTTRRELVDVDWIIW